MCCLRQEAQGSTPSVSGRVVSAAAGAPARRIPFRDLIQRDAFLFRLITEKRKNNAVTFYSRVAVYFGATGNFDPVFKRWNVYAAPCAIELPAVIRTGYMPIDY